MYVGKRDPQPTAIEWPQRAIRRHALAQRIRFLGEEKTTHDAEGLYVCVHTRTRTRAQQLSIMAGLCRGREAARVARETLNVHLLMRGFCNVIIGRY